MKDLLKYFKGYIRESLLGPLFKLLEASFELLVPILIAGIVDETIPRHDSSHLYWMVFTTISFVRLAPPRGLATLCTDHCMTCEALVIRAIRT